MDWVCGLNVSEEGQVKGMVCCDLEYLASSY